MKTKQNWRDKCTCKISDKLQPKEMNPSINPHFRNQRDKSFPTMVFLLKHEHFWSVSTTVASLAISTTLTTLKTFTTLTISTISMTSATTTSVFRVRTRSYLGNRLSYRENKICSELSTNKPIKEILISKL